MSNLISREAAIDALGEIHPLDYNGQAILEKIKALPSAEKHGRWVKLDMHPHLADHKCTACGESTYVPTCMGEPIYLFCPWCGAKMEGEEDETD